MEINTAHRLCVAPMMRRTDRHFRYLVRLLTRRTWLYTEMLVARSLLRGDPDRLLAHSPEESPVALQLAGADPETLARAAKMASAWKFDELNLNVGCPSARVANARMGACLMSEPELVADCVRAMREWSGGAVTVKTRLGIDDRDDPEFLSRFVEAVTRAGSGTVIVHARKAVLSGLGPKANRSVPPLDYGRVYALKRFFPSVEIVVNGGMRDLDEAAAALGGADGAMLGRAAYSRPWMLAEADRRFFGDMGSACDPREVLAKYFSYLDSLRADRGSFAAAWRHLCGLIVGAPGARMLRRRLAEAGPRRDIRVVERLLTPFLGTHPA